MIHKQYCSDKLHSIPMARLAPIAQTGNPFEIKVSFVSHAVLTSYLSFTIRMYNCFIRKTQTAQTYLMSECQPGQVHGAVDYNPDSWG